MVHQDLFVSAGANSRDSFPPGIKCISNVDQQLNNDNIKIVDFLVSSQRETSRDSALENAHFYFKNTCDLLRGQLFCSTKYPNIST